MFRVTFREKRSPEGVWVEQNENGHFLLYSIAYSTCGQAPLTNPVFMLYYKHKSGVPIHYGHQRTCQLKDPLNRGIF